MPKKQALSLGVAVIALTAAALLPLQLQAQQVKIGEHDLGGVVTGADRPEAGVWVIAETTDLPTKYAKIVVTDDAGPLCAARSTGGELFGLGARLWPGGFAQGAERAGQAADLKAVAAPNDAAAAQYYPAIYWYAMLQIPPQKRFPRHRAQTLGGNGMATNVHSQAQWLALDEESRLLWLSSAGQRRDPHHPGSGSAISTTGRGVGAAHPVRAGRTAMVGVDRPHRRAARLRACSATGPTASPRASCRRSKPPRPQGGRAQHRHHPVGLDRSQGLSP